MPHLNCGSLREIVTSRLMKGWVKINMGFGCMGMMGEVKAGEVLLSGKHFEIPPRRIFRSFDSVTSPILSFVVRTVLRTTTLLEKNNTVKRRKDQAHHIWHLNLLTQASKSRQIQSRTSRHSLQRHKAMFNLIMGRCLRIWEVRLLDM